MGRVWHPKEVGLNLGGVCPLTGGFQRAWVLSGMLRWQLLPHLFLALLLLLLTSWHHHPKEQASQ